MQPVIIVIEHDLSNRELLETFLIFEGFQVITTEAADSLLQLIHEHHPALVLWDIHLPEMDSLKFYASMKNDPSAAAIPVIAMTTCIMPSEQQAIEDAGFTTCIFKPIDISLLRIYINYHILQNRNNLPQ